MMRWFSNMSHAPIRKFHFGDDFEEERRGGAVRRAQDRAALDEAEQRGYQMGFEAGLAAQAQTDSARQALALEALSAALDRMSHQQKHFLGLCEEKSVSLALDIVRLHGDLLHGFDPHAGFVAAMREVMTRFVDAPYIVARVPLDLREPITLRLNELAQMVRFSGRLVVEPLSDPSGLADFAFEWPDGALRHNRAELQARLADEFARFGFVKEEIADHE